MRPLLLEGCFFYEKFSITGFAPARCLAQTRYAQKSGAEMEKMMKKMKKVLTLLLTLALLCTVSACGKAAGTSSDQAQRVAVLAPSIAETMIDLGCSENIIAIDTQTQGYGYEQLPADLPAFDMMTPDIEQLAALKPDIVFVSGMTDVGGTDPYADLEKMNIPVVNIPSSTSIQGIKDDITLIADCMGKKEQGEKIIADMTAELAKIEETAKNVTDKKTVYFEIAAAPYAYSFGSGTFLNEAIQLVGAENVLGDQEGWLSVDMESVVAANPDVILTSVNYIEDPVGEILSREGWEGVTAVQNGDVYYIDNQSSSLPNENVVKAIQEMAEAIYPETYGK